MDEIQIEILEFQIIQCVDECWFYGFGTVECVPELAGDKQLVPWEFQILDCITDFGFVVVDVGAVNVAVSDLDGVLDGGCDLARLRSPRA